MKLRRKQRRQRNEQNHAQLTERSVVTDLSYEINNDLPNTTVNETIDDPNSNFFNLT